LIGYLEKLTNQFSNANVVNADFLKFEPDPERYPRFTLVGNIPYNITSPVIDWCIRFRDRIAQVVLMVQKELASRIASGPGGKDWSPLAIFTQLHFVADTCFDVAPSEFDPQPAVSSSVIQLAPRERSIPVDIESLDTVVRSAFKQRRKLLVNNLAAGTGVTADQIREALDHVGLDRKCRAEQVSIDSFLKLTDYLTSRNMLPTD
jgi:16S rRNA (adenine1518-N6/adenine1519-N6)-dimethyltransferase